MRVLTLLGRTSRSGWLKLASSWAPFSVQSPSMRVKSAHTLSEPWITALISPAGLNTMLSTSPREKKITLGGEKVLKSKRSKENFALFTLAKNPGIHIFRFVARVSHSGFQYSWVYCNPPPPQIKQKERRITGNVAHMPHITLFATLSVPMVLWPIAVLPSRFLSF